MNDWNTSTLFSPPSGVEWHCHERYARHCWPIGPLDGSVHIWLPGLHDLKEAIYYQMFNCNMMLRGWTDMESKGHNIFLVTIK
jgi:hypothetical protein